MEIMEYLIYPEVIFCQSNSFFHELIQNMTSDYRWFLIISLSWTSLSFFSFLTQTKNRTLECKLFLNVHSKEIIERFQIWTDIKPFAGISNIIMYLLLFTYQIIRNNCITEFPRNQPNRFEYWISTLSWTDYNGTRYFCSLLRILVWFGNFFRIWIRSCHFRTKTAEIFSIGFIVVAVVQLAALHHLDPLQFWSLHLSVGVFWAHQQPVQKIRLF